jgi:hypothetical protein
VSGSAGHPSRSDTTTMHPTNFCEDTVRRTYALTAPASLKARNSAADARCDYSVIFIAIIHQFLSLTKTIDHYLSGTLPAWGRSCGLTSARIGSFDIAGKS